ncbi:MAG: peroxiredoxin [Polyangiaceae bacterium]
MVAKKVAGNARVTSSRGAPSRTAAKAAGLEPTKTTPASGGESDVHVARAVKTKKAGADSKSSDAHREGSAGGRARIGTGATTPKGGSHGGRHVDVGDSTSAGPVERSKRQTSRLSEFRGKPLVLYFYPKDDTPGCTREACNFQEELPEFKRLKVQVVGVSSDSAERHRKFADKYGLEFPLLVDADRAFANACGVIGEKVLYGKRSIGVVRTTFVVDKSGVIRHVFRSVKVDGHAEQVKAVLSELRTHS